MVGFQTHLENSNIKLPMSFSAYILQACAWPFSQTPVSNFNIPLIFEKAVHEFEHFYLNKFNGRKLNWIFNVSQGEVKFLYTKKLYQITMNTFQIAIILLFENVDELSYEEIQVNYTFVVVVVVESNLFIYNFLFFLKKNIAKYQSK